jgi:quercetin 2,3-dioxygenase
MKQGVTVHDAPQSHWVGDGFPVRSLINYTVHGQQLSPFLLLDYAGPAEFSPTGTKLGVGEHPHRGFETVTLIYQGEVEHRDSTGSGGKIGPGDVQWMTAGSGILHEEFHSRDFAKAGGTLEMVQLWVNLPARHKMTPPRYQTLLNRDIPVVELPQGAGQLRVIAGESHDKRGPAQTFTAVDLWDMRLRAGKTARLSFDTDKTIAMAVLHGAIEINTKHAVHAVQLAVFDQGTGEITLNAAKDAMVLVISGEPLNEPIEGYGPFVMNSRTEIRQAIEDFNAGQFGQMAK